MYSNNVYIKDITVLNPVISPLTRGGQISLIVMDVLLERYTNILNVVISGLWLSDTALVGISMFSTLID